MRGGFTASFRHIDLAIESRSLVGEKRLCRDDNVTQVIASSIVPSYGPFDDPAKDA